MNRRQFFGMTAAAVAAAGLPALVLPEKTIFLPPRGGLWLAPTIREASIYSINDDSVRLRFDLGWITATGEYGQAYYEPSPISALEAIALTDHSASSYYRAEFVSRRAYLYREEARSALSRMLPVGAKPIAPKLHRGIMYSAHV